MTMNNGDFKPYKHNDNMDADYYQHPSFGVIEINRASIIGEATPLFGSSIKHNHIITLRILTADLCRTLGKDWIHSRDLIVEVSMSSTQFADAITGLNAGGNNPVTITYIKGDDSHRPEPPFKNKVMQFNDEFQDKMNAATKEFDNVLELAEETHAQKRLIHAIEMLKQQLKNNAPFINKSFTEQMEHTVKEAKGEVESFVTTMIHNYGIEAIKNQAPQIVEANEIKKLKDGQLNDN